MSLFSRNKPTVVEAPETKVVVNTSKALVTDYNLAAVLVKPLITEKAMMHRDNDVYTFIVAKSATKFSVSDAVKMLYKVTPVKVNIVNKLPRTQMSKSRGKDVFTSGNKKAYVDLKKGDTITLA